MSNIPVAPPFANAPHTPDGFEAPEEIPRGPNPTLQQLRDAGDVAAELSNPSYVAHFSKEVAPDQGSFTTELLTAKAWSEEVTRAEAWVVYAKVQRQAAWRNVFDTIRAFRPIFDAVINVKAAIAAKYPQTKAFFGVWQVAAEKAAETRKENKKAAKKNNEPK
jgi:hypothetical protein